jgi:dihydroneopterin triphosphate diphosphatase
VRQPIQVLVYAARRCGNRWEYLLLHRVARGDDFWRGTSGGVEGNETPVEAALRELLEETGFRPERVEELDFTYMFPLAAKWRNLYELNVAEIREHTFVADVTGQAEPTIDPREHDTWLWCGFDEAVGLLHWPDNIEALRRADAQLRHRGLDLAMGVTAM